MDDTLRQQLKDNGYEGSFELSQLVEACGEYFWFMCINYDPEETAVVDGKLVKIKTQEPYLAKSRHFKSEPNRAIPREFIIKKGKTPTEAVARLWLALQV